MIRIIILYADFLFAGSLYPAKSLIIIKINIFNMLAKSITKLVQGARYASEFRDIKPSPNGIRNDVTAAIFGSSGIVGSSIANTLIHSGARVILPYRNTGTLFMSQSMRNIHQGKFGFKTNYLLQNFTDHKEISVVLKDANAVICTLGSKFHEKKLQEYEQSNIIIPREIAKVAAKNPNIKRFIYFSCTGADPNSPLRLQQTKWYGEQEVKYYFPTATIIRPTTIYHPNYPYDGFVSKWLSSVNLFVGALLGTGGGKCKIQPTNALDIAQAVYNVLLMPQTVGQTFELGGPLIYQHDELIEYFFNYSKLDPYIFDVPLDYVLYYITNKTSKWVRNLIRMLMLRKFRVRT